MSSPECPRQRHHGYFLVWGLFLLSAALLGLCWNHGLRSRMAASDKPGAVVNATGHDGPLATDLERAALREELYVLRKQAAAIEAWLQALPDNVPPAGEPGSSGIPPAGRVR